MVQLKNLENTISHDYKFYLVKAQYQISKDDRVLKLVHLKKKFSTVFTKNNLSKRKEL